MCNMKENYENPIIPGHSNDYDIAEMSFNNGKEYMREKILEKLYDAKGKALGAERCTLSEVIEMVEKLRARV